MNWPLSQVLAAMAQEPGREMTAVEICRLAHLPPGGIYDVLMKATRFAWVTSRWDNEGAQPRSRLYQLTADGEQRAAEVRRAQTVTGGARDQHER